MSTVSEAPVRFCPFCRDAYEAVERCPEHDLPLVALEELPSRPRPLDPARPLPPWSLRAGRGWLLLAVVLLLVAPALPWVEVVVGARGRLASGYGLAMGRAVNVWIVPAVVVGWLLVLRLRRTPIALRSARMAVALLAPLPLGSAWTTWQGVRRGLEAASRRGVDGHVTPAWGLAVLLAGVLCGLWAAVRLGRLPDGDQASR